MAISVYTWSEFVSAFQGSETEIEIMANLNCNDAPLSATLKPGSNKTINGNGHTINHLGAQQPLGGPMFSYMDPQNNLKTITWNKVNFMKVISNESEYIFLGGYSSSYTKYYYMYFDDCMIQGKGVSFGNFLDMKRCSLTWEGGGLENIQCTYCWLHIDQFRSENPGSGSYEMLGSLNSCYLEGEVTHAEGVTSLGRVAEYVANCCINLTTHEGPYWSAIATGGDYRVISVLNIDKFKGSIGSDYYCAHVSDEQAHNAAELSSVNFDIVS